MNDPVVEEMRRIRDAHSRSFNYSLDAICEEYKARQASLGSRLVRLQPKKLGTVEVKEYQKEAEETFQFRDAT